MHELPEEAQSVEQSSFKHLKDQPEPVFGEVRVDLDGNKWVWVKSHHTKSEEADIDSDMARHWERNLQMISDDVAAEVAERNGLDHKDVEDENDVAGRWQAMG